VASRIARAVELAKAQRQSRSGPILARRGDTTQDFIRRSMRRESMYRRAAAALRMKLEQLKNAKYGARP
jgi:hypothetical protein